jgi:hypothetical protein
MSSAEAVVVVVFLYLVTGVVFAIARWYDTEVNFNLFLCSCVLWPVFLVAEAGRAIRARSPKWAL